MAFDITSLLALKTELDTWTFKNKMQKKTKKTQCLEQGAQGGGGVTIPGGVEEIWICGKGNVALRDMALQAILVNGWTG